MNSNRPLGNRCAMDARTDAALIAAAERTPALFAVVFDRHFATIHRYLDRRVGRDAADDLAGQVFCSAFEQRRHFQPLHESALPWLYGIATNLLLKQWRRGARERHAFARLAIPRASGHNEAAAADDRLDAVHQGKVLRAALGRMPQGDRNVVLLVAWEELTYAEVATALGIPEGTVRSRLHRARRALRLSLDASTECLPAVGLATGRETT